MHAARRTAWISTGFADRGSAYAARGTQLSEQDVFVNVVGGIQIDETGRPIWPWPQPFASLWKDIAIRAEAVLIGEIGPGR